MIQLVSNCQLLNYPSLLGGSYRINVRVLVALLIQIEVEDVANARASRAKETRPLLEQIARHIGPQAAVKRLDLEVQSRLGGAAVVGREHFGEDVGEGAFEEELACVPVDAEEVAELFVVGRAARGEIVAEEGVATLVV